MAIHRFKPALSLKPPRDPVAARIAAKVGDRLLTTRLARKLPRATVVQQTGINWKRLRALEEGAQVAALDEILKLAKVYRVRARTLLVGVLR